MLVKTQGINSYALQLLQARKHIIYLNVQFKQFSLSQKRHKSYSQEQD